MEIYKSYKFRLYPNEEQRIMLVKTLGSVRYVYNHFLSKWNSQIALDGNADGYRTYMRELSKLCKSDDLNWLDEVDVMALKFSVENLKKACQRYLNHKSNLPKFKLKNSERQAYSTKYFSEIQVIKDNFVYLPKIGYVKFAKSREVQGKIYRATVRKKSTGKFFISLLVKEQVPEFAQTGSAIGIDVGIRDFITLSNGIKIKNLGISEELEKKLIREQRKLSRKGRLAKEKGIDLNDAKNYQKQKLKVAKIYERITNKREDFFNKLSTELVKNHDVICMENLDIKDMTKNKFISKKISEASWYLFENKIFYKAKWYGKKYVRINRWFPSSQICHECGSLQGKKKLHVRTWSCSVCGAKHDRDVNAAINILNQGIKTIV